MTDYRAKRDLEAVAKAHLEAEEFAEAEVVIRRIIDGIETDDHLSLWIEFVGLASVLNRLDRADEGTAMYQRALAEARQLPSGKEANTARYMLANQYLIFGDPRDALEMTVPIPAGSGHVQCLLHAVAAGSLWKLERRDEARAAAQRAIAACPTDERRAQLSEQLANVLGTLTWAAGG